MIRVTIEKKQFSHGVVAAETNRIGGKYYAHAIRLSDDSQEEINRALAEIEAWRAGLEAKLNDTPEDWREPRDEHGNRTE